jgi:plasmid maintenance system antidote protein VapI
MSIFEYSDYKSFLRDQILVLPKKGRGEINRMAKHLRVHPTLISQVLNGTRDFSAEQIYSLCGYFGLQQLESDYLVLLLQFERAGTSEFKKYYTKKIDELKLASLNISKRLTQNKKLTDYEYSIFY